MTKPQGIGVCPKIVDASIQLSFPQDGLEGKAISPADLLRQPAGPFALAAISLNSPAAAASCAPWSAAALAAAAGMCHQRIRHRLSPGGAGAAFPCLGKHASDGLEQLYRSRAPGQRVHPFWNHQMNTRRDFLATAAVAPLLAAIAPGAQAGATTVAAARLQGFPLSSVRLLPGPFEAAQSLVARYLLSLNVNRLLHGFRVNAGLEPKAPRYGGWESRTLCPGHTLGHYLSACSMMWASTGQAEFRQRVKHIVDELHGCQQSARSGLVCAFPDGDAQLRNALAGRDVIGVPWYTMHKIMAGLYDAHVHAADPHALPVLARLADWMVEASQGCDDQRFQTMLWGEHGGMNEVLADLH